MGTNNGFKKEKEEKDKNTCSIPNEYILISYNALQNEAYETM